MKILAFDSSTSVSSVAFVTTQGEESNILFRSDVAHRRSDSSALFEGLEKAVSTCGIPEALCVGLGPGSYNGLRAAIATARAFATALELPLYALPSPIGLPGPDSGFWVVGDARGGHYWVCCIASGNFLQEPQLLPPGEILQALQAHPSFPVLSATPLPGIENLTLATPDAGRLAILAEKADPCVGTPEPLYLKPPHITTPRTVSA